MCKTHETPSNATQAPAHAAEWAKQRFNKTATPGEADFSKLVDDGDLLGIPSLGAAGGSPKQDAPARSIIARASFIALSHFPAAFRRKKAVQRASIQLGALTARLRELVSLDKLDAEEQAVCTAAVAILQVRRRVCTAAGRAQGMVVLMRVTGSHGLPACGGCTVGTHSRGEGGGAAPVWRALRRAPAGGHGSSCRPSSNSGSAPPLPPCASTQPRLRWKASPRAPTAPASRHSCGFLARAQHTRTTPTAARRMTGWGVSPTTSWAARCADMCDSMCLLVKGWMDGGAGVLKSFACVCCNYANLHTRTHRP